MSDTKTAPSDVHQILSDWEALLSSKTEAEIIKPMPDSDWSVQDVIGHLRAWQQVSIARMEAAQSGGEPIFPDWVGGLDPDEDDDPDDWNARIYAIYHAQSWPQVYKAWHDGFVHLLELAETIPAEIRSDTKKYPWLKGASLDNVLVWSGEHHQEHLDALVSHP